MSATRESSIRQDLANGIVRFYAKKFGRGPTQSRCFVEDTHAAVILGDVQTTVERTLAAHGHEALVKDVRRTVQGGLPRRARGGRRAGDRPRRVGDAR